MSNSTLLTLRTKLRDLINAEDDTEFFTNARLNRQLQDAYGTYYRRYVEMSPQYGQRTVEFTFPAEEQYYDVVTSGHTIEQVEVVEDKTDIDPGYPLVRADSKRQILGDQSLFYETLVPHWEGSGTVYNAEDSYPRGPSIRFWFEKTEADTDGVITITQRIWLGPRPTINRELEVFYQAGPQALTDDTYTTGLPDFVERPLLYYAAILCRTIEEPPPGGAIQNLRALLDDADRDFARMKRPMERGGLRIEYFDPN